ncbi:MAG: TraR/DksA family transcriptional regulator [Smithella sp.]|jgi:DnaK suppressor protein|nr:TraR/DksA family transcriptional regulator [Smithella sp.]
MNKNKTSQIRNYLVQKMEALRTSANDTIIKLKISDDKFADPFDQAAVEASKEVDLNCLDKDWHLLLDIKETIMRIDSGLFGICDHCGRPISQKRLMAAPMSKLCVMCQEEIESRHNKQKHRFQYAGRISYSHV